MKISRLHINDPLAVLIFLVIASCGEKNEENKIFVTSDFDVSPSNIETDEVVYFTNKSENASFYQWDFGDGNVAIDESPSHVYSVDGVFQVTLIAIGENDSDTSHTNLTVTPADSQNMEITIFDGEGIAEIYLGETWKNVINIFETDTLHYIEFIEDLIFYLHTIYFYNEGVVTVFPTLNNALSDNDQVAFLYIVSPYEGTTKKGIKVGNSMAEAVNVYGEPETVYEEDGISGYGYPLQGIDFFSYNNSEIVDEIDVYEPFKLEEGTHILGNTIADWKNSQLKWRSVLKEK